MRKITLIMLAMLLSISIIGCGNYEKSATAASSEPVKSETAKTSQVNNGGKTLVVYFSLPETTKADNMTREEGNSTVVIDGRVLGNTEYVAGLIQKYTKADIFRIEPKVPYTTNHSELVQLAKQELLNNARPELLKQAANISQYDTIFIGYPNWWGDMPMIVYTFLENVDLTGKKVIPFNTHGGSGFSNTIETIAQLQPKADVYKTGYTVSRDDVQNCESAVESWLK